MLLLVIGASIALTTFVKVLLDTIEIYNRTVYAQIVLIMNEDDDRRTSKRISNEFKFFVMNGKKEFVRI